MTRSEPFFRYLAVSALLGGLLGLVPGSGEWSAGVSLALVCAVGLSISAYALGVAPLRLRGSGGPGIRHRRRTRPRNPA